MGDAPRLLARLQAQQGRPEAATFRQLHSGIAQLLALRRLVATLAPGAAAAAAAAASQADDNSDGEATGIGSKHSLGSGLFVGGWADGSADWLGDRPTAWGSARAGLLGADGGQARDGRGRGGRPRSGHATAWDRLPIAKKVLESITSELEACECRLSAPPPPAKPLPARSNPAPWYGWQAGLVPDPCRYASALLDAASYALHATPMPPHT